MIILLAVFLIILFLVLMFMELAIWIFAIAVIGAISLALYSLALAQPEGAVTLVLFGGVAVVLWLARKEFVRAITLALDTIGDTVERGAFGAGKLTKRAMIFAKEWLRG